MPSSSKPRPPSTTSARSRPAPSLSERALPSQSARSGWHHAASTDNFDTPEQNASNGSVGPLVKSLRGLLKSQRRKCKEIPPPAGGISSFDEYSEEPRVVPTPSDTSGAFHSTPTSSHLLASPNSSLMHADPTARGRTSLNSLEDVETHSVFSGRTACSSKTVKRSNTQQQRQREQYLHSVNENTPEERQVEKVDKSADAPPVKNEIEEEKTSADESLLEKTKRRFRKMISNGSGSALSSSASTTAIVGEDESAYQKSSTTTPQASERRRSSGIKGLKTLKTFQIVKNDSKAKGSQEEQKKEKKRRRQDKKNHNICATPDCIRTGSNSGSPSSTRTATTTASYPEANNDPPLPRAISIFDSDDLSVDFIEEHNRPTAPDVDARMKEDPLNLMQMWGKDDGPPPPHSRVVQNERRNDGNGLTFLSLLTSCQCPVDQV